MDVRSGGTLNLFLNTTEGVMADEKVRQAALAALNCDDILMAGYGDADLYKLNAGWCNQMMLSGEQRLALNITIRTM